MSDEVQGHRCDTYSDQLTELALGVLTGRERAQALSHVESCRRCADELEQLSRAADTVVQVAPEVEPPMGFEVRLFEKMGVSDARRRRFRPSHWIPAAAAVAAAAVALGLGLTLPSSGPTATAQEHRQRPQGAHVISAPLMQDGVSVGRVATFGGDTPWMSMMLDDEAVHGTVSCVVVTDDGRTHHVGTFVAREGYSTWASPLSVNPKDIRTAEVVSPGGTVVATATLG
jgi:anti-sigma factor RsiW